MYGKLNSNHRINSILSHVQTLILKLNIDQRREVENMVVSLYTHSSVLSIDLNVIRLIKNN